uniref:Uncharacterized protein n=1 Tax=Oryza punctata TaxID=4537 RepID=A0A0E0JXP9_ORYPU
MVAPQLRHMDQVVVTNQHQPQHQLTALHQHHLMAQHQHHHTALHQAPPAHLHLMSLKFRQSMISVDPAITGRTTQMLSSPLLGPLATLARHSVLLAV